METKKGFSIGKIVFWLVVVLIIGFGLFKIITNKTALQTQVIPTSLVSPTLPILAIKPPSSTALPAPTMPVLPVKEAGSPTAVPMSSRERLNPLDIPKYVDPLVIPHVMEPKARGGITEYEIAVRQFQQQILPAEFPATTVWGYGRLGDPLPGSGQPSTFNYPAFTVEAQTNERVRVTWVNQLVDDPNSANPHFLPHILPVDGTLPWANPGAQDMMVKMTDQKPYTGPIPIVAHVHGSHVASNSDGGPDAWFLPAASDIPAGFTLQGPKYQSVIPAPPGAAVFEYTNDQRATTLWYHDHTMGITRLNVQAGMAGFWLIRDDIEAALNLPGPAPMINDPVGTKYYEIPIAIQDRSFNTDGSFFYPDSRKHFDDYEGPYSPESPVPPIWNPEVFGDTMVVNGKTWPYLEVEPRLYRFRFLNGTNARFLILGFDKPLQFHQIGTEGGLLPDAPVVQDQLYMGPAERADVIVDFSKFKAGDEILLLNQGPDSPLGSLPVEASDLANNETTGQVMKFKVIQLTDQGNPGVIPAQLPSIARLTTTLPDRFLTLNETAYMPLDIPVQAQMGTLNQGGLNFEDPITENPMLNDTEIWSLINLTGDTHPVHLHMVMFQVLDRTKFDAEAFKEAQDAYLASDKKGGPPKPMDYVKGAPQPPEPWEMGWKDTVMASPEYITRIIATFDLPGLYVWHCHILEHEDMDMMRPFFVGPIP
jgi:spore coat protein A, manganese oxidase